MLIDWDLSRAQAARIPAFQPWRECLMAWLDRRPADMITSIEAFSALMIADDPEALFQEGWLLCDAGEHGRALDLMRRAVAKGYFVAPTLSGRPQFDPVRNEPAFQEILAEAVAGREQALASFREGGGERLLGR